MLATIAARTFTRQLLIVMTTGFALFAMFFGSGNLVFPVMIGAHAHENYGIATVGLILSGVVLPFIGIFAVVKNKGSYSVLFNRMSPLWAFTIPLFLQLLMGPLGAIPRCINVAYGGFHLVAPEIPLWLFSAGMSVLIWYCIQNPGRAIKSVGRILTPFLLASIFAIVWVGTNAAYIATSSYQEPFEVFAYSFNQGYQTMDLLAAFFFSTAIYTYLMKYVRPGSMGSIRKLTFQSSIVAGLLLCLVYAGFLYLGAAFSLEISAVEPQHYLGQIAHLTLGNYAGPIVSFCIGLACLTTALVLTRVFVDYLYVAFPRLKIKQQTLMIGTVLVSFLVSTLEFNNIAAYIGPIMVILYPGLIALALTGLSENPKWHRWTQPLVLSAFALGALSYFGKPLTSYL